jgi:flagellar hook-associated protein 2
MGFGQITFGGLASGLDTSAIISALLQLEERPIRLLEGRKAEEEGKLDLVGTFEGLVEDLQEKAQGLTQLNGFYAHTLSVGTEGIADITLGDGAQSGSHVLKVFSLAAADRHTFDGVADPTAGLGTGTIDFDYDGTSYSVSIAAGLDSLNDIAGSINSQAGDAVTASVINTGTEGTPNYQIVIAGNETGADFGVENLTVSGVGLTGQLELTNASNASIELDGLKIQRSTNVFSDVLAGVSFTVSSADAAGTATTTFSIDSDPEGIETNLQELVDAYNAVIDFVNEQNEYSEEGGAGGELFGDSILRTVRSNIQQALFDVDIATVQADTEGYSTLGLVGIEVDSTGRLSIDSTTLEEKMGNDLDAFASLFLDATDGVLVKLDTAIDDMVEDRLAEDALGNPILNPVTGLQIQIDGIFTRRRNTIDTIVDDIDDEIERLRYNVERLEESLVQRFSRLEELIGGLNSQSSFLNSLPSFPQP